jgi:hypothetical protein
MNEVGWNIKEILNTQTRSSALTLPVQDAGTYPINIPLKLMMWVG